MDRLAETHQSRPHSQVPSCPLIPTYALPAPIVSTPDSHHITVNFSSTPFSLDPIQPTFDAATPMDGHSMIKRSAFHDLKDRVEKRIRTSLFATDVAPNISTAPHVIDSLQSFLEDFFKPESIVAVPIVAVPQIPLQAIETLHQASFDILKALIKKDAVDREKQLMVAVGTFRTCLEVEFLPHMEVWQEDARNRASTDPAAGLWDSRSNTSKPPPGTPTGPRDDNETKRLVDPSRVDVRMQLAEAQVNLRNFEKRFRDKESELARSQDENKVLSIELAKSKESNRNPATLLAELHMETKNVWAELARTRLQLQSKTTALSTAKVDQDKTVSTLNKTIADLTRKIEGQKTCIHSLRAQNSRVQNKNNEDIVKPAPPRSGKNRRRHMAQVGSERGQGQTGLIRRGDSMERDAERDEASTTRHGRGRENMRDGSQHDSGKQDHGQEVEEGELVGEWYGYR